MEDRLVFGIDGGGTRSRIAFSTLAGKIVCKLEGSSTNPYASNYKDIASVISTLIDDACTVSGHTKADIIGGCIGNAGLSRPGEKELFKHYFKEMLGSDIPVLLCNDAEILMVGGLGEVQGLCLIAGTGSIALGRLSDGRTVRSGGLGWRLGDEGSAWWIAQQAVNRLLRSEEQRDFSTIMRQPLMEYFKITDVTQLVPLFNGPVLDKSTIAGAAPIVSTAAVSGDALATDILQKAAVELVDLVVSVVKRLPELESSSLVCAGGVLEHDTIVIDEFSRFLSIRLPNVTLQKGKGSALDGSLVLARDFVQKGE